MTSVHRNASVLVLSPDALARNSASYCLESFGYTVVVSQTAADAVRHLREQGSRNWFSVLVTDVDSTGFPDGMDVAILARELNPAISVIYTSSRPHTVPLSRKVKAAPILRTPYRTQQLVGLIGELRSSSIETARVLSAA